MNRPAPNLPTRAYQTFQVKAPKGAFRSASCEEVECQHSVKGWKMVLDLSSELGLKQAHYIKHQSGRKYTVEGQTPEGMVTLLFPGNQPCFQEHKVRTDLPETFLVKGGDFRGNPLKTATRVHKRAEFWVEEFQTNQDRIARAIEKG